MYGNMGRRMAASMQESAIARSLVSAGVDPETFDIHAHMDRSLHLDENLRIIRKKAGISTRDRGRELHQQREEERRRERIRRQDTNRQTGRIQTHAGRELDALLMAHRPGKRRTDHGTVYYERRENRSDVNPRERL